MKREPLRQRGKMALEILLFFLKIGWFTFGGGWSIVAQMEKEFVEKRGWITREELLDYAAIGKSIPGTMIGNCSFLFGYHMGGSLCAVAAMIGISFAPMVVLAFLVPVYDLVRSNAIVKVVMVSIRAAVLPIMLQVAGKLFRSALPEKKWWFAAAAALCLYLVWDVSPLLIVLLGAAAGILLERKDA